MSAGISGKFNRVSAPVFASPKSPSSPSEQKQRHVHMRSSFTNTHGRSKSAVNTSLRDPYSISYRSRTRSPFPVRRHGPAWKNPEKWIPYNSKARSQIPNIFDVEVARAIQETAENAAALAAATGTGAGEVPSRHIPIVPKTAKINSGMLPSSSRYTSSHNSTQSRRLMEEQKR